MGQGLQGLLRGSKRVGWIANRLTYRNGVATSEGGEIMRHETLHAYLHRFHHLDAVMGLPTETRLTPASRSPRNSASELEVGLHSRVTYTIKGGHVNMSSKPQYRCAKCAPSERHR